MHLILVANPKTVVTRKGQLTLRICLCFSLKLLALKSRLWMIDEILLMTSCYKNASHQVLDANLIGYWTCTNLHSLLKNLVTAVLFQ
jgi:hypothetical protein